MSCCRRRLVWVVQSLVFWIKDGLNLGSVTLRSISLVTASATSQPAFTLLQHFWGCVGPVQLTKFLPSAAPTDKLLLVHGSSAYVTGWRWSWIRFHWDFQKTYLSGRLIRYTILVMLNVFNAACWGRIQHILVQLRRISASPWHWRRSLLPPPREGTWVTQWGRRIEVNSLFAFNKLWILMINGQTSKYMCTETLVHRWLTAARAQDQGFLVNGVALQFVEFQARNPNGSRSIPLLSHYVVLSVFGTGCVCSGDLGWDNL